MKILITGTHLTPALAVIEQFKNDSNIDLVYIGRSSTMEGDKTKSIESQIFSNLGIKFLPLISGRLQKVLTPYTVLSLFKIPIGFIQAIYYLLIEKPDVILSFGGYISVPVVICSWLLNIKIIIHEQTLVSGFANTISSYFADKIAVSFSGGRLFRNKNITVTGNPIRREILNPIGTSDDEEINKIINFSKKEKKPLIFITGGNQGSHVINEAISESLNKLTELGFVIHQTGDSKYKDFDKLSSLRLTLSDPERYLVRKWIDGSDFGFILKNADLAVSRSGINTMQELAFWRIPTIAIPLPYLFGNEQTVNAGYFEKAGLVKVLYQKDLTPENLLSEIKLILKNLNSLKEKALDVKNIIIPDADKRLALETIILAKMS